MTASPSTEAPPAAEKLFNVEIMYLTNSNDEKGKTAEAYKTFEGPQRY